MSILGRMLFLLCLFLLATMTIVGGFSYFNYRENCRMGEYGVQRAALGAANYAQLFLHTAARDVRQLARAPQVLEAVGVLPADMKKGTPLVYEEPLPPAAAALRSLLDMTVYGSHRVLQVGFVDMRGGFMASPSLRVVLDHDPRKRPWFLRALASPGEVARSSYLSSPGNEPVCSFSQAVLDKGQVVGVVYMEVSLHMFSQAMNVLKPGVSGAVYVLDRDGVALAAPGRSASCCLWTGLRRRCGARGTACTAAILTAYRPSGPCIRTNTAFGILSPLTRMSCCTRATCFCFAAVLARVWCC